MMTHLGRVVYDRKKNPFSQADITRILKTALDDMTPREAAEYMTQVLDPYYQKWRAHPFIFAGPGCVPVFRRGCRRGDRLLWRLAGPTRPAPWLVRRSLSFTSSFSSCFASFFRSRTISRYAGEKMSFSIIRMKPPLKKHSTHYTIVK